MTSWQKSTVQKNIHQVIGQYVAIAVLNQKKTLCAVTQLHKESVLRYSIWKTQKHTVYFFSSAQS